MGRPVVSNWGAVNQTVQPGGAPQITVTFAPASDNKNLWFRFDLRQNPGTWIEGDWVQANKTAGSVTLTYTRGGVQGMPSDWGGNKQISLDAQLVWGEGGRGSGQLIGRKPSLFNIASTGGSSVSGSSTAGTQPTNFIGTAVNTQIPVGGPAKLNFKYDSDVDGYLRLDLKKQAAVFSKEGSPVIGWNEGTWEHIGAGKNKTVTLTFTNVPPDWKPANGVNWVAVQVVWSASGSGRGKALWNKERVFQIVPESQEVINPDTGDVEKDTTSGGSGGSGSSGGGGSSSGGSGGSGSSGSSSSGSSDGSGSGGDSTVNGIMAWLKQNWIPLALIGVFLLLVTPGKSSKND